MTEKKRQLKNWQSELLSHNDQEVWDLFNANKDKKAISLTELKYFNF